MEPGALSIKNAAQFKKKSLTEPNNNLSHEF